MTKEKNSRTARGRITPALVISCVALFAALAGTALALPQNSVRSPQIVDGTIRTVDLRDSAVKATKIADNAVTNSKLDDNAVTSIEVKDESLTASDLGDASVGSSEVVDQSLASSDIGPAAVGSSELAAGAVGSSELATGAVGTSELATGAVHASDFGSTIVRTGSQAIAANSSGGAFINCPATEVRLSGGVVVPGVNNVFLQSSFPNGVNGWTTIVRNNTAAQITVQPYVLCLQA